MTRTDHVHFLQSLCHTPVHGAIECRAVFCLETRRVNKHILRIRIGTDTHDAVARRLRLARGNAQFFTDQPVQQRGLTHVGAANNDNEARRVRRVPGVSLRK